MAVDVEPRTGGLLLKLRFAHERGEVLIVTEAGERRFTMSPDVYDVEYALRQVRCVFDAVWQVYDLGDQDLVSKYGETTIGPQPRYAVIELHVGSLDAWLRLPGAILGAPLAALIALMNQVLDLDIKIHTHPLRREKAKLELEIDVARLKHEYGHLMQAANSTALPPGQLQAMSAELVEETTG